MIRFYSLFVTDDNLLASPYVRRFNVFHDITLHRGITEKVNFLIQTPLTNKQHKDLSVIFDPSQITIEEIEVKTFKHQSLITATIIPKKAGSVKLGFAFPQTEHLHRDRLRNFSSPLSTVLCSEFDKKAKESKILVTLNSEKGAHEIS